MTYSFSPGQRVLRVLRKTGKRVSSLSTSNLSCRLDVTDNGDSGTRDTYAPVARTSTGALYHQVGTTTAQLPVKAGEVVVRTK